MAHQAPRLLTNADVNGHQVSFFSPPHTQPDFPWVDIEDLAAAFLDTEAAKRMVQHAQNFDRDKRPVTTARNGDKIATIIPHALAQGLCGAIDQWNGFVEKDEGDTGPAHNAYCRTAGIVAADHWPLDFDQLIHAFRNPGGPFLEGL
ncbi:conserved hypothetical protein [Sphingomonas sp. T1]|uniref:hypothetical protein n=1 Tax=Sphingomonas sp. T1 TaxID=2653172 RepID=UPI0012F28367|nr:hypothetical protein [Sphingomonas sp. T1]VXD07568.1 conserved hypothetical protein [Sphingomonas sp. T1]